MFLGESINAALEELWQLSLTLSSLKYISGLVSQELSTESTSTGHEEEIIQGNESHRPSHVDKKEAPSYEKEDIIMNEDVESNICFSSSVSHSAANKDAPIELDEDLFNTSMVAHFACYRDEICIEQEEESVSMVSHQAEHLYYQEKCGSNDTTQTVEIETDEQETGIPYVTSLNSHQLSPTAIPVEFPEFLLSMAAHTIIQNYENNEELSNNVSCIAHKVTNEETTVEQCSIFYSNEVINEDAEYNETEKNEQIFKEHSDLFIMEEKDSFKYLPSSVSHSVAFKDISTEPDETNHIISMNAHCKYNVGDAWSEEGKEVLSMVCHKATSANNEHEYVDKTEDLTSDTQQIEHIKPPIEQPFLSSMTCHQLPTIETPAQFSEIPISMAVHVTVKNYENFSDPHDMESFIVHHVANINEETPRENKETGYNEMFIKEPIVIEDKVEIESDFLVGIPNDKNGDVSPHLSSSMCAHTLPYIATSTDEKVDHVSLSAHRCAPHTEEDTDIISENGIINSMVAHIISLEETTSDAHPAEELADIDEIYTPTGEQENYTLPFHSSMVSHQLSQFETPDEFPEFMVSCVSHGFISNIDQYDPLESDPGLLTTMIAHQNTIKTENENNIDLKFDYHWKFYEKVNEENITIEETKSKTYFQPSMYTHHLPPMETPIEMSNNLATMAVHKTDQSWTANTNDVQPGFESCLGMIPSMLSHHVTTETQCLHSRQEQQQIETAQNITSSDQRSLPFYDLPYFISMVSHTIPYRDIPIQFETCLMSAASHGLLLPEQQEDNLCHYTSMVVHHQNMESYNQYPGPSEYFKQDFVRNIIESEDNFTNKKENKYCDKLSMNKRKRDIEEEDNIPPSDSSHTSMVAHKLTSSNIPIELFDYFSSSTVHRINGDSNIPNVYISDQSMLVHKISDSKQEYTEDDPIFNQNDNMGEEKDLTTQEINIEVDLSNNQEIQGEFQIKSYVTNQSTLIDMCDPYDYSDCPSIEPYHHITNIEEIAEQENTDDISSVLSKDDLKEICHKNLTNNEDTKENWESLTPSFENENNCAQDVRPAEINEDLAISASFDNLVSEEQNNENDIVINDFNSNLTRIRELQKIVEDEIEEFENKRKNNSSMNENNLKITETHIVSNVKGIEFKSSLTFHQLDEYIIDDTEHLTINDKDISLNADKETSCSTTQVNDLEMTEVDTSSNGSSSDLYNSVSNLVHGCCTIENNNPIKITASHSQLNSEDLQSHSTKDDLDRDDTIDKDQAGEEKEQIDNLKEETSANNDYIFNDLKKHLRRTPRKSSTSETKIREAELMKSFLQTSSKESVEFGEEKDCHKKYQKSSIIFSTLNENVKKHSYKIRFKVKVGAESSKHSVLQYLLGCFGGEKLIPAKK